MATKDIKKRLTTNEILSQISDDGGFPNRNRWNKKECAQWVKSTYECSNYVANNVASFIVKGWR